MTKTTFDKYIEVIQIWGKCLKSAPFTKIKYSDNIYHRLNQIKAFNLSEYGMSMINMFQPEKILDLPNFQINEVIVQHVSTSNIDISTFSIPINDLILLTNQIDKTLNGIYVMTTSGLQSQMEDFNTINLSINHNNNIWYLEQNPIKIYNTDVEFSLSTNYYIDWKYPIYGEEMNFLPGGNFLLRNSFEYMIFDENYSFNDTIMHLNETWVVGNFGAIFKWVPNTTGSPWTKISDFNYIPIDVKADLYKIKFINDEIGFICGADGLVARTSDKGLTWRVLDTNVTDNLRYMDFYDINFGIIVGDNGLILTTNDSGDTWIQTHLSILDVKNFKSCSIFNWNLNVFGVIIVGQSGCLYRMQLNKDLTWSPLKSIMAYDISTISNSKVDFNIIKYIGNSNEYIGNGSYDYWIIGGNNFIGLYKLNINQNSSLEEDFVKFDLYDINNIVKFNIQNIQLYWDDFNLDWTFYASSLSDEINPNRIISWKMNGKTEGQTWNKKISNQQDNIQVKNIFLQETSNIKSIYVDNRSTIDDIIIVGDNRYIGRTNNLSKNNSFFVDITKNSSSNIPEYFIAPVREYKDWDYENSETININNNKLTYINTSNNINDPSLKYYTNLDKINSKITDINKYPKWNFKVIYDTVSTYTKDELVFNNGYFVCLNTTNSLPIIGNPYWIKVELQQYQIFKYNNNFYRSLVYDAQTLPLSSEWELLNYYNDDELIVGTWGEGLKFLSYDTINKEVTLINKTIYNNTDIKYIRKMYLDSHNVLFISCESGLYYLENDTLRKIELDITLDINNFSEKLYGNIAFQSNHTYYENDVIYYTDTNNDSFYYIYRGINPGDTFNSIDINIEWEKLFDPTRKFVNERKPISHIIISTTQGMFELEYNNFPNGKYIMPYGDVVSYNLTQTNICVFDSKNKLVKFCTNLSTATNNIFENNLYYTHDIIVNYINESIINNISIPGKNRKVIFDNSLMYIMTENSGIMIYQDNILINKYSLNTKEIYDVTQYELPNNSPTDIMLTIDSTLLVCSSGGEFVKIKNNVFTPENIYEYPFNKFTEGWTTTTNISDIENIFTPRLIFMDYFMGRKIQLDKKAKAIISFNTNNFIPYDYTTAYLSETNLYWIINNNSSIKYRKGYIVLYNGNLYQAQNDVDVTVIPTMPNYIQISSIESQTMIDDGIIFNTWDNKWNANYLNTWNHDIYPWAEQPIGLYNRRFRLLYSDVENTRMEINNYSLTPNEVDFPKYLPVQSGDPLAWYTTRLIVCAYGMSTPTNALGIPSGKNIRIYLNNLFIQAGDMIWIQIDRDNTFDVNIYEPVDILPDTTTTLYNEFNYINSLSIDNSTLDWNNNTTTWGSAGWYAVDLYWALPDNIVRYINDYKSNIKIKIRNISRFGHINGNIVKGFKESFDIHPVLSSIYSVRILPKLKPLNITPDEIIKDYVLIESRDYKQYFNLASQLQNNTTQNISIEDYSIIGEKFNLNDKLEKSDNLYYEINNIYGQDYNLFTFLNKLNPIFTTNYLFRNNHINNNWEENNSSRILHNLYDLSYSIPTDDFSNDFTINERSIIFNISDDIQGNNGITQLDFDNIILGTFFIVRNENDGLFLNYLGWIENKEIVINGDILLGKVDIVVNPIPWAWNNNPDKEHLYIKDSNIPEQYVIQYDNSQDFNGIFGDGWFDPSYNYSFIFDLTLGQISELLNYTDENIRFNKLTSNGYAEVLCNDYNVMEFASAIYYTNQNNDIGLNIFKNWESDPSIAYYPIEISDLNKTTHIIRYGEFGKTPIIDNNYYLNSNHIFKKTLQYKDITVSHIENEIVLNYNDKFIPMIKTIDDWNFDGTITDFEIVEVNSLNTFTMIGTDKGLYTYKLNYLYDEIYTHQTGVSIKSSTGWINYSTEQFLPLALVNKALIDKYNNLWIATTLGLLNITTNQLYHNNINIINMHLNEDILYCNSIDKLFKYDQINMVEMSILPSVPFNVNDYTNFNNNTYFATTIGLLDKDLNILNSDPISHIASTINDIYVIHNNILKVFVPSTSLLNEFITNTNTEVEFYPYVQVVVGNIINVGINQSYINQPNIVNCLYVDSYNRILMGTDSGLWCWNGPDYKTGHIYSTTNQIYKEENNTLPLGVNGDRLKDSNGKEWFFYIGWKAVYGILNNNIISISETPNGILLSTGNEILTWDMSDTIMGLHGWNYLNHESTLSELNDGLKSNVITHISAHVTHNCELKPYQWDKPKVYPYSVVNIVNSPINPIIYSTTLFDFINFNWNRNTLGLLNLNSLIDTNIRSINKLYLTKPITDYVNINNKILWIGCKYNNLQELWYINMSEDFARYQNFMELTYWTKISEITFNNWAQNLNEDPLQYSTKLTALGFNNIAITNSTINNNNKTRISRLDYTNSPNNFTYRKDFNNSNNDLIYRINFDQFIGNDLSQKFEITNITAIETGEYLSDKYWIQNSARPTQFYTNDGSYEPLVYNDYNNQDKSFLELNKDISTLPVWNNIDVYDKFECIEYLGNIYRSIVTNNVNNIPTNIVFWQFVNVNMFGITESQGNIYLNTDTISTPVPLIIDPTRDLRSNIILLAISVKSSSGERVYIMSFDLNSQVLPIQNNNPIESNILLGKFYFATNEADIVNNLVQYNEVVDYINRPNLLSGRITDIVVYPMNGIWNIMVSTTGIKSGLTLIKSNFLNSINILEYNYYTNELQNTEVQTMSLDLLDNKLYLGTSWGIEYLNLSEGWINQSIKISNVIDIFKSDIIMTKTYLGIKSNQSKWYINMENLLSAYTLVNGLTFGKVIKDYQWIFNANIHSAYIGEQEIDGKTQLIWYDGVWKCGLWIDGIWCSGTWENGTWLNGKFGTWETKKVGSYQYQVNWRTPQNSSFINLSKWINGRWINGTWENGIWYSGCWTNGIHNNGIWLNGTWANGLFINGEFQGGNWCDGRFFNGKFNETSNKSIWHSGYLYGGDFEQGLWVTGVFDQVIGSTSTFGSLSSKSSPCEWRTGTWINGTMLGSNEHTIWHSGLWKNGLHRSGTWILGTWENGIWENGIWVGSVSVNKINNKLNLDIRNAYSVNPGVSIFNSLPSDVIYRSESETGRLLRFNLSQPIYLQPGDEFWVTGNISTSWNELYNSTGENKIYNWNPERSYRRLEYNNSNNDLLSNDYSMTDIALSDSVVEYFGEIYVLRISDNPFKNQMSPKDENILNKNTTSWSTCIMDLGLNHMPKKHLVDREYNYDKYATYRENGKDNKKGLLSPYSGNFSFVSNYNTLEKFKPLKYHVISYGETLGGIALKYKVTVAQIMTWNGLKTSRIVAGRKLLIYTNPNTEATFCNIGHIINIYQDMKIMSEFKGGIWKGGIWLDGVFSDGEFQGGIWINGTMLNGKIN
jgi:hypothetical protein